MENVIKGSITEGSVKRMIICEHVRRVYMSRWFFMRWLLFGLQILVEMGFEGLDDEQSIKHYEDVVLRLTVNRDKRFLKIFNTAKADVLNGLKLRYPGSLGIIGEIEGSL